MESKFNDYWAIFTSYVDSHYDLDDELIKLKYIHTGYVARLMYLIANKMNLNKNSIELAYLIGLFHDLGRFEQVVREKSFNDKSCFDHGGYSNKILFTDKFINNFNIKPELYPIIRKAVYFHNKRDIRDNLTEEELFYCKLIRDADKIDIIRVMTTLPNQVFNSIPKNEMLENYFKNKSIDVKLIENSSERVLLNLSFMKDLNFQESMEILEETGNMNNYLKYVDVKDDFKNLFNLLVKEIKEKNFELLVKKNNNKEKVIKYVR